MSASDAGSGSDTATVPQIPGFMRDMWDPNVNAWVSVPMDDPNATVLNTPQTVGLQWESHWAQIMFL